MRVKVVRLSAVTEEMEVSAGTSVEDLLHDAAGSRVFSAVGAELAHVGGLREVVDGNGRAEEEEGLDD